MFHGITYGYPEYLERFLRNAMKKTVGFNSIEVYPTHCEKVEVAIFAQSC